MPNTVLDSLWARYLEAKSKNELTVAKSLVASPGELKAIHQRHSPSNNESDFLTIDWLRRRVDAVQDPALKSYFAIIADDYTPALCAPAHCYRALINSVIAVSVQSNLQIGYVLDGDVVYISNYAQLLRDLHAKHNVELRLTSGQQELAFSIERWRIVDNLSLIHI